MSKYEGRIKFSAYYKNKELSYKIKRDLKEKKEKDLLKGYIKKKSALGGYYLDKKPRNRKFTQELD